MLTILHLSVVMAFIASILDLSRILQRGTLITDSGPQVDSIQPLIKSREIGYAFSNSLRFIFFWIFVAEPPKAERDTSNARAGVHSGNWGAWGFVGLALRWLTLSLSLAVFALQVVWRLDSKVDEFTNAYSAESAIQVILSAILALKILLNCSHCTITSKRICVLDYLGFLVSLHLSLGLGIANILHRESLFGFIRTMVYNMCKTVKFTETMLGRFLQGVNFYLLVLSSLLTLFMPPWGSKSSRVPSFRPLSPKPVASSFNITPPDVSTPDLSLVQPRSGSPILQPQTDIPWPARRMSGWLATQRQRLSTLSLNRRGESQVDINIQLWKQNRAERGLTHWEDGSKDSDVYWKAYGNPDSYPGTSATGPPTAEKPQLEAPRFGRGFIRSMSSRYSDPDLSTIQSVHRQSWQVDSPVFGLNGIVRPSTGGSAVRSQGSATVTGPDRSSNVSELFRKQEELDSSIAALKLLESPLDQLSSPTSSKQSAGPSATRSEFSLSNFPDPPWVTTSNPQSPSPIPDTKPSRFHPPNISVNDVSFELVPPRMPASMMEHNRTTSLPVSETGDSEVLASARTARFDSQGTQYDVTSFIGSELFKTHRFSPFLTF